MSKTPLVKTSGRASSWARARNCAGGQILASNAGTLMTQAYQKRMTLTRHRLARLRCRRGRGDHAVAPAVLGRVERPVGALQHAVPVVHLRIPCGDARG